MIKSINSKDSTGTSVDDAKCFRNISSCEICLHYYFYLVAPITLPLVRGKQQILYKRSKYHINNASKSRVTLHISYADILQGVLK